MNKQFPADASVQKWRSADDEKSTSQATSSSSQNPYSGKIHVLRIYRNHTSTNLRAFADVKLGRLLIIHGVKVIQQEGQRAYCRLPDKQIGNRWYPVLSTDNKEFKEALSHAVLTAWEEMAK